MNSIYKKFKNISTLYLITTIELLVLFLGILTTFLYYAHFQKIFGNSASRFLLVIAPYINIGRPYTDIWEFVPPGFLTVTSAWVYLFGWGMESLKIFQILILTVIGISFLLVVRRLFKSIVVELPIFLTFVFVFYSPLLQTDMLSIELFGIAFALLAFVALLYIEDVRLKIFISSFLFFMASQMKETLTFSISALIPYCLSIFVSNKTFKLYIKQIFYGFAGIIIGIVVIFSYLYINDSLIGYKGVLDYKFTRVLPLGTIGSILTKMNFVENLFAENVLHSHNYLRSLLLIDIAAVLLQVFLKFKFKRVASRSYRILIDLNKINIGRWQDWSGLLFGTSIFLGLIMYGQYSIDARLIPVTVSFFILFGILIKYILNFTFKFVNGNARRSAISFMCCLFLLVFISPQIKIIKSFFNQIELHVRAEVFGETNMRSYYFNTSSSEINDYIYEHTTNSDCILNPYGWEVAETYIYSMRKPCSKYFLVNMALSDKSQIEEYKKDILQNPPTLIFYNTQIVDLNIENFSKTVIDYPNAIKNCYILDVKFKNYKYIISGSEVKVNLYWKRNDLNLDQFKTCFLKFAIPNVLN